MPSQESENLALKQGPQMVCLLAGQITPESDLSQQSVQLPVAIVKKSRYLSSLIMPPTTPGDTLVIELPKVHPAAIRLYACWLQFENVPLFLHDKKGPVAQPRHSLMWREVFDLVQAHILGSRFDDLNFQRYILGQLDEWLAPQQQPDSELLDYLWGQERDVVGDELLCFVMSHMFQIDVQRVGVLVGWLKGLIGGRRMTDYIESIEGPRGGPGPSNPRVRETPGRNSKSVGGDIRAEVLKPRKENPAAAQGFLAYHLRSRDNTPPLLYHKHGLEKRKARDPTQRISEGVALALTPRQSQQRKAVAAPKAGAPTVPRRMQTQRQSMPPFSQGRLDTFPPTLRLHPNALASIANKHINAEMERQRTSSPLIPPSPSLHPSIREALAYNRTLARPLTPQEDHLEFRDGARHTFTEGGTTTMPPILDEALQSLNFWTDPSPSDLPGPDFWADLSHNTGTTISHKGSPSAHRHIPQVPEQTSPVGFPPYNPTTKQIIQSFNLTRTPTPRRRATRSWSVASIRSLDKGNYVHGRSMLDRPARGLISRKPVPISGMEFLSKYADGEMLKRVVSVNSRPRGMGSAMGREKRDREELWERGWEPQRPGTA